MKCALLFKVTELSVCLQIKCNVDKDPELKLRLVPTCESSLDNVHVLTFPWLLFFFGRFLANDETGVILKTNQMKERDLEPNYQCRC